MPLQRSALLPPAVTSSSAMAECASYSAQTASSRHPFFEFYNEAVRSFDFHLNHAYPVSFATRTSSSLPDLCATVFGNKSAAFARDMQILSISIDAHCRAVDDITDFNQPTDQLSPRIQLTTLLLLKAVDRLQRNHGLTVLDAVYHYMGRASLAHRTLCAINNYEAWLERGAVALLGEKNASLLVIPATFNQVRHEPWPAQQCEDLFAGLFTLVQQLDDVIDYENDRAIGRYTHFRCYLRGFCEQDADTNEIISHAISYAREAFDGFVPALKQIEKVNPAFRSDRITNLIGPVSHGLSSLERLDNYSDFAVRLAAMVPPVLAYAS
jgi:hypothetical protein